MDNCQYAFFKAGRVKTRITRSGCKGKEIMEGKTVNVQNKKIKKPSTLGQPLWTRISGSKMQSKESEKRGAEAKVKSKKRNRRRI